MDGDKSNVTDETREDNGGWRKITTEEKFRVKWLRELIRHISTIIFSLKSHTQIIKQNITENILYNSEIRIWIHDTYVYKDQTYAI